MLRLQAHPLIELHLRVLSGSHTVDQTGELAWCDSLTVLFVESMMMMILEYALSRAAHYVRFTLACCSERRLMLRRRTDRHRHRKHTIQVLVCLRGTQVRLCDREGWRLRGRPLLLLLREASSVHVLHAEPPVRFLLRRYIRFHPHTSW
jgi:hypothetical protein